MSIYTYAFFVCNILHLNKICLCCFVDMHLYYNFLPTTLFISSLLIPETLPAFSVVIKMLKYDKVH